MRSFLFLTCLAFGTAACAHAGPDNSGAPSQVAPEQQSTQGRIVIGEQSNVCVSVTVDQRVWPRRKKTDTDSGLSGVLASELRQLYEERGGSSFIPEPGPELGPRPEPRFANDFNRANPICRDTGEDIYVTTSYVLRSDGTPFVFNWRIEQGAVVRTGSADRDIFAEIRAGRIFVLNIDEPVQVAVGEDIRSRAAEILNEIAS